jgi:hypothetical protein
MFRVPFLISQIVNLESLISSASDEPIDEYNDDLISTSELTILYCMYGQGK